MKVCARDLRHKVRLLRKSRHRDELGGYGPETYTQIAEPYAKIENISGREALQAEVLQGLVVKRFTMRYRNDLVPPNGQDLTIEFEGRRFNIKSVSDWEERKRFHVVIAEEGGAE